MKDSFGCREIFPTKCKPQEQIHMYLSRHERFYWMKRNLSYHLQTTKADQYVNVKTWKILLDEEKSFILYVNLKSRFICLCQDMKDSFGWEKSFILNENHKSSFICTLYVTTWKILFDEKNLSYYKQTTRADSYVLYMSRHERFFWMREIFPTSAGECGRKVL